MPLFCTFFSVIIRISFARIKFGAAQVCVRMCASTHYFSFSAGSSIRIIPLALFPTVLLLLLLLALFAACSLTFSSMKITLNSTMNCEYTLIHTHTPRDANIMYGTISISLSLWAETHSFFVCTHVLFRNGALYNVHRPTMDKINCIRDSIQMVISNKEIV